MPKEIKDLKEFLHIVKNRKDASKVTLLKSANNVYKFKARCSRYLYTLKVTNKNKVDMLKQSLPPGLKLNEIKAKKDAKKK